MDEYLAQVLAWAREQQANGVSADVISADVRQATGLPLQMLEHIERETQRVSQRPQAAGVLDAVALQQAQQGMPSDSNPAPMPSQQEIKQYEDLRYLQELYVWAKEQQANGVSMVGEDGINADILSATGGKIPGFASLEIEMEKQGLKQPEDPYEGDISTMRANRLGTVQGLTFNLADEIGALPALIPGGESYGDVLKRNRQLYGSAQRQHPVAYGAGEVMGQLPFFAVPGVGVARATANLPKVARIGARIGGTALTAGTESAAYAAAGAEEGQRVDAAKQAFGPGAAVGGVVGVAAPALAPLGRAVGGRAGRGLDDLVQRLTGGRAGVPSGRAIQAQTGQRLAQRELSDVLERSGRSVRTPQGRRGLLNELDELRPDQMVGDLDPRLFGRKARAMVNVNDELARHGGQAERIGSRARNRGERIADRVEDKLGRSTSVDELQKAQKALDEFSGYKPLEGKRVRIDPELLQNEQIAKALKREGVKIADDGTIAFTEMQAIDGRLRGNLSSRNPNTKRLYREASTQFNEAIEEAMPEYRKVNADYRAANERIRAYDAGAKAWSKTARDIESELAKLRKLDDGGLAEQAYRRGALNKIKDQLLEARRGGQSATKLLDQTEGMKRRLQVLFGTDDPRALKQFLQAMDDEVRMEVFYNKVFGNSTTIEQAADAAQSRLTDKRFRDKVRATLRKVFDDDTARREAADKVFSALAAEGEDGAKAVLDVLGNGKLRADIGDEFAATVAIMAGQDPERTGNVGAVGAISAKKGYEKLDGIFPLLPGGN